ncbi:MAG TPA: F0F1 ATP synthase subunit gamma [Polyangiaceae bacterium]|nr:F0F1 ATP synthase subunit gamma [Polyangiaceae bacterium]
MQRLAELQARIHSLSELGDVVSALRAVSAARVEQARGVLEATRRYTQTIEEAISEAIGGSTPLPDETVERAGGGYVVAFGSEYGFVGSLNHRVLDHALHARKDGDTLLLVGSRLEIVATERREPVAWSTPMAAQIGAVDGVALRVAAELARACASSTMDRVILVYTASAGGGARNPVSEAVLPFDVRRHTPAHEHLPAALSTLPRRELVDGLAEELLFAELAHAATESFASENIARLATMEAAADNVRGKLGELDELEHELRQEDITMEMLDVVTGAAAVDPRAR